jgi:hypothetical protein
MRCLGVEVERLDGALASLARGEAALRLRLGQVLEVASRGACFALGFSSVAAYALERCDRSVRWAEAARCLARRVEALPELRAALALGKVSWSMGELLARVAQPEDEARWLESAASHTVRQMRGLVSEASANARAARGVEDHAARQSGSGSGSANGNGNGNGSYADRVNGNDIDIDGSKDGDSNEICTLSCSVAQEDAWLFEATRALLGQLGTHGADAQLDALLAEGQGTLLAALPTGALDHESWQAVASDQQRWLEELARWRTEAEVRCEARIRDFLRENAAPAPVRGALARAAALGMGSLEQASANELDGNVRDLARALVRHELQLSRLVLRFHRADGWRRLGYATEAQYARERLGMSHSSWLAKRALALRLQKLPRVAAALGIGQLGVEAAVQIVRVATPTSEAAWVERARHRTIKHLREEVAAALVAVRVSGELDCPPPATNELAAFHELERAVVSGRACQPRPESDLEVARAVADARRVNITGPIEPRSVDPTSAPRRAWLQMLGSLSAWLESGLQSSAAQSSAGPSSAGPSSAGQTCAGQTCAGQTSTAQTSAAQTSAGPSSAAHSSAAASSAAASSAAQSSAASSAAQTSAAQTSAGQAFAAPSSAAPSSAAPSSAAPSSAAPSSAAPSSAGQTCAAQTCAAQTSSAPSTAQTCAAPSTAQTSAGQASAGQAFAAPSSAGQTFTAQTSSAPSTAQTSSAPSTAQTSSAPSTAQTSSASSSGAPSFAAHGRAPGASVGKVEIRLRVSRPTYAWYRGLEAQARRWLPCGMSWLRFLCLSLWHAWRHLLGADVAYGKIYIRDRFRCLSPVCSRRDVTPHHLQFRSAGGSDEPCNIGSFCCWCHLEGVHGGRIRARGTADDIRWELGVIGAPCLVVQGRERLAA